jgi:allantoin racemase
MKIHSTTQKMGDSSMRVLVINPNSTAAMTAHVAAQLHVHMNTNAQILQRTASQGHAVIATQQAFDDGAQTACAILRQAVDEGLVFDKVLLACFGDPGLEAMRLQTQLPVVGLAQASMQAAERISKPYAIVTAGAAWQTILMQRFRQWGASDLFCGVQVIEGTGLDVFNNPVAALPAVQRAIHAALAGGAEQIILGGAVFAGYKAVMQKNGIDAKGLLDCIACAAETLVKSAQ